MRARSWRANVLLLFGEIHRVGALVAQVAIHTAKTFLRIGTLMMMMLEGLFERLSEELWLFVNP